MKISGKAGKTFAPALFALMLFALLLSGAGNIAGSRLPDGLSGWLASHWRAGDPTDCRLCPEHLFVIVCDVERQAYVRDLRKLASLKAEYLKDPKAWSREAGGGLSCIERGSFRLPGHAGGFGAPYDEGDPAFRWNLSFQVLRDDAAGQLVEVRYQDSRTDIDDALFRYEVVAGAIKPLESRVLTRGHFAMLVLGALGVLVVLCLGWGLYFVAGALRRYLAARRGGQGGD
jgi:hypothetical protein